MTKRTQYDVIIVGAGLVGSALALSLAQETDLSIATIERAQPLPSDLEANQRVVALGQVASGLLDRLGILSELGSGHCHAYEQMFVWDENSQGELRFTAAEQQQPRLGYMVDSARCTYLLQQALAQQNSIDGYFETKLDNLRFGQGFACLSNADGELSAPLIVAADGANSWLRRKAKIFANHHSYQQQGIVALIETTEPHQNTAWQRFLRDGPLAVLPVANNQSSIVWSADNDRAEALMKFTNQEFESALSDALQGKLGEVSLCSKRQSFALQSLAADHYFKRHLVLVGDAAHSIHPLAGQGANLGFKDVQSLVSLIADDLVTNGKNAEIGRLDLLQQYQRARRADNKQTDFLMSALHTAYQRDQTWWAGLRGFGMNWLSDNALIKRELVKQAMGL